MNIITISLILLCVVINTAAQLALKIGMDHIGHFDFTFANILSTTWQIIVSPWIIAGMFLYVLSVAFWLLVLSRVPVSIAYPMISLGYITSAIAAYYFLGEDLNLIRISGIVVILVGVFLVARS